MSYLVLARKYRPQKFSEVIGQEHITELFSNAIASKRIAHAFLFCGPRGIGKTSCARILAKSLNCENGPTVNPCGECAPCREITGGNSFDVIEIDGASNRGIDEIRTLRENVKFAPSYGRFKIYIVDEVHMLTSEAFNALLKTLEEPPQHAKFIFATTEANKVPVTIISRCQRFDFKRITIAAMIEALKVICQKESLNAQEESLFAIAKAAQGSMRDALSILDQLGALNRDQVKSADVFSMLGLVETQMLFELVDGLCDKDCSKALETFNQIIERGKDIKQLGKDLAEHYRHLMVIKIGGKSLGKLIDYPATQKDMLLLQSQKLSLPEILRGLEYLIEAQDVARITETHRMPLELAFAKMTYQTNSLTASKSNPQEALSSAVKPNAVLPAPSRQAYVPVQSGDTKPSKEIKSELTRVSDPAPVQHAVETNPDSEAAVALADDITIADIRSAWNSLTHEVSRHKMSLASYLQDGNPYSYKDGKLVIGFASEHVFNKESLEHKDNLRMIMDIFSEKLRRPVVIQLRIIEEYTGPEIDAKVDKALNMFKGKVVNQWHND